jgi:AraC family transcriptional regulator, regulatory protein of adaptative response / methylated-DNA-[protein]-cysteine methyltransferase
MTDTTTARDYVRIETAIQLLAEADDRLSLDDVAAAVGLSPFHFQRLFKRWAGLSPKRFQQYLTIDHAKALLANSSSVLDAAYGAGLSGPSRLHDLFVACEAMTPGEYKARGADLTIRYGFQPSPFGECLLYVTERGLCGLGFVVGDGAAPPTRTLPPTGRGRLLCMTTMRWRRWRAGFSHRDPPTGRSPSC